MTPAAYVAIGVNALSLAFAAGGAWWAFKQVRRDLNGLGAKVNKQDAKFVTLAILLLAGAADKDKELLADRLLDKLCR